MSKFFIPACPQFVRIFPKFVCIFLHYCGQSASVHTFCPKLSAVSAKLILVSPLLHATTTRKPPNEVQPDDGIKIGRSVVIAECALHQYSFWRHIDGLLMFLCSHLCPHSLSASVHIFADSPHVYALCPHVSTLCSQV